MRSNKYITRIRLGLSQLWDHEFKHSFQDSIYPICNCGNDAESVIYFFLHCTAEKMKSSIMDFFSKCDYCPLHSNERCTILNSLSKIDHKLSDSTNTSLTKILLFGNSSFTTNDNTKIINLTIDFALSRDLTGHFYEQWLLSSLIQIIINKLVLYYLY